MDPKQMTMHMMEFHKMNFDNAFNTMVLMQDQSEKMMRVFLEQSPWMPAEGKKLIDEWLENGKKGRAEFKSMMDAGYEKISGFFAAEGK